MIQFQYLIIAAIVVWALLYSAWSLMPAGGRRALAERAAGWARHWGLGEKQVQGLQARLAQPGSCSGCSTCSGCGKPTPPAPRVSPRENDGGANDTD
jgi:hypothetical protein